MPEVTLRKACEPIFRSNRQSQWRTREHYAELYTEKAHDNSPRFFVVVGDCRGDIDYHEFETLDDANQKFDYYRGLYNMDENEVNLVEKVIFS